MKANDSFHIAVLPGDGIGTEVMAPALEVLRHIEATTQNLRFRFTEAPAAHPATPGQLRPGSSAVSLYPTGPPLRR